MIVSGPLEWFYVAVTITILASPLLCVGPKGMLRVRRSQIVRAPVSDVWRSVDVLDPGYVPPKRSETILRRVQGVVHVRMGGSPPPLPVAGNVQTVANIAIFECLERQPMRCLRWLLRPGPNDPPDVLPPKGLETREMLTLEPRGNETLLTLETESYEPRSVVAWLGQRSTAKRELAVIGRFAERGERT